MLGETKVRKGKMMWQESSRGGITVFCLKHSFKFKQFEFYGLYLPLFSLHVVPWILDT